MNKEQQSPQAGSSGLISGVAASLASMMASVLHPLDILKSRVQSHDGQKVRNIVPQYRGIVSGLHDIFKTEGIRGLYRGLIVSQVSANIGKFIFFGIFGMQKVHNENFFGHDSEVSIILTSFEASIMSMVLTAPLNVIKTRMLLNTETHLSGIQNLKNVVTQIYSQHGPKGFFRGLPLSLMMASHGTIQLSIYEKIKKYQEFEPSASAFGPALYGPMSKFATCLILNPLSVIKVRVQQNQYVQDKEMKYKGIVDCGLKLWKIEGLRGMYKGFLTSQLRGLPSNAMFFYFYEYFKGELSKSRLFNSNIEPCPN